MTGSVKPQSILVLSVAAVLIGGIILTLLAPRAHDRVRAEVVAEAAPPKVIRFAGPGAAKENQKMWGLLEIARSKGFLEQEFAGEDVRFEFIGFTTVPAVGEALASGATDFAGQGELIAILARSNGADTRLLMPVSRLENAYVVVPVDSPVRRLEDLRGKRLAYMRGGYIHIQTLRILEDHGLSENDIQPVNLDPASAATVLASGGVDGVLLGWFMAMPMRDRGVGRIVYDTHDAPTHTAQTGLIVRNDFAERYPQTTQRVVNALVRAAHWAADPANRQEALDMWTYGTDRDPKHYAEDVGPEPLIYRASPLLDPFALSQYEKTQKTALQANLMVTPVDLSEWIDTRFLERALETQKLTHFWPVLGPDGQPQEAAR